MRLGNTKLVNHGIQTEQCDLRFHVGVATRTVYIFSPSSALKAMSTGKYKSAYAYTGSLKTAVGYLIPPEDIDNCRFVPIPDDIFYQAQFCGADNTSVKGKKAELIVNKMIRHGLISLILDTVSVSDEEMNIGGEDLIAITARSFQVKCDWLAGPKSKGGSGNLYIQTGECNPMKLH